MNDNVRCEKDGESCRYDPEMGGVRIEHVVDVTSKGCRNLTEMEICLEVQRSVCSGELFKTEGNMHVSGVIESEEVRHYGKLD